MLGKIKGKRRKVRQRIRWLDSTTASMGMNVNKFLLIMEDRGALCARVHEVAEPDTI